MWMYVLALVLLYYVVRWYRELERVPDRNNKYVYITGCDSGFGNLLARHLDKKGFCVVAACFTEKGEEELKKSCSSRVSSVSLDVRKPESIDKAADFIKDLVGQKGLWAVVNNAGVSVPSGSCDWMTLKDYKDMLEVNLNGVIGVTLSVLPLIKKARGRVVNVASVFGRIGAVGGPYCVSKFAVEGFNDSLRKCMHPFGVKVLCIEPGFFKTMVTDSDVIINNVKMLWGKMPKETREDYGDSYINQVEKLTKENLSRMADSDLMKVVSCMEHAVSAVHPRTRYSPGWDAKLFWLPLSYVPTCVSDYLLMKGRIKPAKAVI
ncbi:retinol dehydrogenase 7-like [Electrophorus electricus]|uniref:Dehydrogenase/reductase (SDR family) member 9 n=1 Tax=Electrophorus electricus TaxID=8005 RepID=A0A4W4EGE8_ELEEL|nr:retinol dehydrogenase 7-like [Electrophorus electricus]